MPKDEVNLPKGQCARTPPHAVHQTLRQEVSYGCPVEGCRKPFLTWHHFDPPWSERQHHNPQGMLALCRTHHDFADRGGFLNGELRALKASQHSTDSITGHFPWAKRSLLTRLGGCYSGGSSAVLSVSKNPVIRVASDPSGQLSLSFILKAPDGEIVASMADNVFQSDPSSLHDLKCNASANSIKIWFAPKDIGLDLSFSRITIDELDSRLVSDRERTERSPAAKGAREATEHPWRKWPE